MVLAGINARITFVTTLHPNDTPEPPNTRARVRLAADELMARGDRVSVRAVRELIGRGSDSTISAELRKWRNTELARRSASMQDPTPGLSPRQGALPAALAQEAQLMYLRVLAHVGSLFSAERATAALASATAATQQLAEHEQVLRLVNFGTGVSADLVASVEERARLAALLVERDATVEQLQGCVERLTAQLGQLSQQLAAAKLAAAEREALSLTRVEGLSKHLLRATEEQRSQIAAPLAQLQERYAALQLRETVMTQQLNSLRDENSSLLGGKPNPHG